MALGADRRNVMKLVLKGAMKYTGVGLCIGVPIAILLHSHLYKVSELDPSVLGAVVIGLSSSLSSQPACRPCEPRPLTQIRRLERNAASCQFSIGA
jgi:hypothetical protein